MCIKPARNQCAGVLRDLSQLGIYRWRTYKLLSGIAGEGRGVLGGRLSRLE